MVTHWPERPWWRPAVRLAAVLAPLLTCAILATVRGSVTSATSVLVLVVWVVAAAATGDRVAGVLAALSGALWFDFFLTEPYLRFTISTSADVEVTVLLVLISVTVTEVALWGYRQQAQSARRSGYLDGVVSAARAVAEGDLPTSAVVDVVAHHIAEVLDADDCRFEEGAVHDTRVAVLDHDGVLTHGGRTVDVERVGLPPHEYVAVLVRRGSRVVGHFLVSATTHVAYPDRERCRVAVLLADQVAAAVHSEPA